MWRTNIIYSKGFRHSRPPNSASLRSGESSAVNRPRKYSMLGRFDATRGFTLIETMFVLVIIAILVALAYPAYLEQIRKSRRADAETALLERAQILERCFTRINTYANPCPSAAGLSENGYYLVTEVRTATTYALTATAQGDQDNDACNVYGLDHLGNKSPGPSGDRCWGVGSS